LHAGKAGKLKEKHGKTRHLMKNKMHLNWRKFEQNLKKEN